MDSKLLRRIDSKQPPRMSLQKPLNMNFSSAGAGYLDNQSGGAAPKKKSKTPRRITMQFDASAAAAASALLAQKKRAVIRQSKRRSMQLSPRQPMTKPTELISIGYVFNGMHKLVTVNADATFLDLTQAIAVQIGISTSDISIQDADGCTWPNAEIVKNWTSQLPDGKIHVNQVSSLQPQVADRMLGSMSPRSGTPLTQMQAMSPAPSPYMTSSASPRNRRAPRSAAAESPRSARSARIRPSRAAHAARLENQPDATDDMSGSRNVLKITTEDSDGNTVMPAEYTGGDHEYVLGGSPRHQPQKRTNRLSCVPNQKLFDHVGQQLAGKTVAVGTSDVNTSSANQVQCRRPQQRQRQRQRRGGQKQRRGGQKQRRGGRNARKLGGLTGPVRVILADTLQSELDKVLAVHPSVPKNSRIENELWRIFSRYSMIGSQRIDRMDKKAVLQLLRDSLILDGSAVNRASAELIFNSFTRKRTDRGLTYRGFIEYLAAVSHRLYEGERYGLVRLLAEYVLPNASRWIRQPLHAVLQTPPVMETLNQFRDFLTRLFFHSTSNASVMTFENWIKLSNHLHLKSINLTATELRLIFAESKNDIEGDSMYWAAEDRSLFVLTVHEFVEAIGRAALMAFSKCSAAAPADLVKAFFQYLEHCPYFVDNMQERLRSSLVEVSKSLHAAFVSMWTADGRPMYLDRVSNIQYVGDDHTDDQSNSLTTSDQKHQNQNSGGADDGFVRSVVSQLLDIEECVFSESPALKAYKHRPDPAQEELDQLNFLTLDKISPHYTFGHAAKFEQDSVYFEMKSLDVLLDPARVGDDQNMRSMVRKQSKIAARSAKQTPDQIVSHYADERAELLKTAMANRRPTFQETLRSRSGLVAEIPSPQHSPIEADIVHITQNNKSRGKKRNKKTKQNKKRSESVSSYDSTGSSASCSESTCEAGPDIEQNSSESKQFDDDLPVAQLVIATDSQPPAPAPAPAPALAPAAAAASTPKSSPAEAFVEAQTRPTTRPSPRANSSTSQTSSATVSDATLSRQKRIAAAAAAVEQRQLLQAAKDSIRKQRKAMQKQLEEAAAQQKEELERHRTEMLHQQSALQMQVQLEREQQEARNAQLQKQQAELEAQRNEMEAKRQEMELNRLQQEAEHQDRERKMREEADVKAAQAQHRADVQLLKAGATFIKLTSKGKEHSRYARLSEDALRVEWDDSLKALQKNVGKKKAKFITLNSIKSIQVKERRNKKTGASDDVFSVVTADRTLDLIAPTKVYHDTWVNCLGRLMQMMEQLHH
jgi:Meiotic cell cortex C-terminal pleckstrin homology